MATRAPSPPGDARRPRFGRAAIALALLLGTVAERVVSDVIPAEALDTFHVGIAIAIAFLVARWYRGFMRRTLSQRRNNRRRPADSSGDTSGD